MISPLPTNSEDVLRQSTIAELMRLLVRDEDRVPRNAIDECARRGDDMLDSIAELLDKDYYWGDDQTDGEWWRLLHAVMILGLMSSGRAGELLVRYMRRMDEAGDEPLEEWLSGWWPALFRNKPANVVPALQALGEDRRFNWYIRGDAVDAAIAWIQAHEPERLDEALARAGRIAASKDEDFDLRVMVGLTLLSFPRARDRRLLERLADAQPEDLRWFGREEIIRAYAIGGGAPEWERFADPWKFYEPEAMAERARLLAEAEAALEEAKTVIAEEEALIEPYVRPEPKVGRNDPCPCGSGKKYKKCCMER
jgi:hypothetical protein